MLYLIGISIIIISLLFIRRNKEKRIADLNTDTTEIIDYNRVERLENYDKQIDGYTQLIKLLENDYKTESDQTKKAAKLKKLLVAMEKLDKTIEKREKLEE